MPNIFQRMWQLITGNTPKKATPKEITIIDEPVLSQPQPLVRPRGRPRKTSMPDVTKQLPPEPPAPTIVEPKAKVETPFSMTKEIEEAERLEAKKAKKEQPIDTTIKNIEKRQRNKRQNEAMQSINSQGTTQTTAPPINASIDQYRGSYQQLFEQKIRSDNPEQAKDILNALIEGRSMLKHRIDTTIILESNKGTAAEFRITGLLIEEVTQLKNTYFPIGLEIRDSQQLQQLINQFIAAAYQQKALGASTTPKIYNLKGKYPIIITNTISKHTFA